MRLLVLIGVLALAACSTVEPKKPVEIVRVDVPVAVPCIDKAPVRPTILVGQGPYPGDVQATQAIIRALEAFEQYGTDWEAAAAGCVKKTF